MLIKRILLIIVLSFSLFSCINSIDGNGKVIKEDRTVSSFHKIDISGGYEVIIREGDVEKLELEVDENLLDYIETKVENNILYISNKDPLSSDNLKLYITYVAIDDIDVSGAITLKNKGTFSAEELEIEVSGAGDIDLDVAVAHLKMDMSGASETTLKGKADDFEIEISGAGDLEAKNLKTKHTSIDMSGAGSAVVNVKKTLNVEVSGAGSVKYKGNPKITKDISGAGAVEKL